MEADLPTDEESRLDVLRRYQVLDTPEEREFDDLVHLAAYICGTPISLVSLVDTDRQWFKGRHGLEIKETPRRISFCGHSILKPDEVTEVPDATRDGRFADNELVTGERHIRFYAGAPLVTPEGAALGTLCVLDTTPRRLTAEQMTALKTLSRQVMTQLELRRQVAELEATSKELVACQEAEQKRLKELEAFSYTLSHDMRAPLRAINNFTGLVLQGEGEPLGPRATGLLEKVVTATRWMDRLITDVLAFSRVSRKEMTLKPVGLDELIKSVLDERIELQSKARVQVCHPLGQVMADETSLSQCVWNLLENAIKYVAPGIEPDIQVFTEAKEDKLRLVVADNGIGVPMEAQEKIFGVFERLHSASEYEGTGIGLAIVKRAVERMGGRAGVESEPGKGSRFWIELRTAGSKP